MNESDLSKEDALMLWGELFRTLEKQAIEGPDGVLGIREDVTIPAPIADYLLRASFKMMQLSWGQETDLSPKKFWYGMKEKTPAAFKEINPTQARSAVIKALSLAWGRGGGPFRNFKKRQKLNSIALNLNFLVGNRRFRIQHSFDVETETQFRTNLRKKIQQEFNVEPDQANNLITEAVEVFGTAETKDFFRRNRET